MNGDCAAPSPEVLYEVFRPGKITSVYPTAIGHVKKKSK